MDTKIEVAKAIMKSYKGNSLAKAKAAMEAVGKDPYTIERYYAAQVSKMHRNGESFLRGAGCPWWAILWEEVRRQIVGREQPSEQNAFRAVTAKYPGAKLYYTEPNPNWTGRLPESIVAKGCMIYDGDVYTWEYHVFEFGRRRLFTEYVGKAKSA